MKRVLLLVLFIFVSALTVFAMETGGSARLVSLGNPKISIADSTLGMDLYENGFISGIFTRKTENTLIFYPSLQYNSMLSQSASNPDNSDELQGAGGGNGLMSTPSDSGLVFYPSDNFVLIFRPYGNWIVNKMTRNDSTPPPDITMFSDYMYAGELAAAFKITPGFAVSLLGGYTRHGLNFRDDYEEYPTDYAMDNLEYEASASLLPEKDGGMAYALTIGNKKSTDPMMSFSGGLDSSELMLDLGMFTGMGFRMYEPDGEDAKTATFTAEAYSTNIMHVNFAMSDAGNKGMGLTAMIGAKVAPDGKATLHEIYRDKDTGKETTEKIDEITTLRGIYGAQGSVSLKGDLGAVMAGLKLGLDWTHLNKFMYGTAGVNMYNVDVVSGVSVKAFKGIQLPVEVFYKAFNLYTTTNALVRIYDFGGSLGAEFEVSEGFALRCGADYTILGQLIGGQVPGSNNNPFITTLGINAGVGFKSADTETNIGLRFENRGTNPYDDTYDPYSDISIRLLADVKFAL